MLQDLAGRRARPGRRGSLAGQSPPRRARCRGSGAPRRRPPRTRAGGRPQRAVGRPAAGRPRRRSAGRSCRPESRARRAAPQAGRTNRSCTPRTSSSPLRSCRSDDAALPRLAERLVDTVEAPDGEHVRGVAAADVDGVRGEDLLADPLPLGLPKSSTWRCSRERAERIVEGDRVQAASPLAVGRKTTRGRSAPVRPSRNARRGCESSANPAPPIATMWRSVTACAHRRSTRRGHRNVARGRAGPRPRCPPRGDAAPHPER